jgi:nitrite reductase/ring-hydroxylating ferredoxin subunit
VLVWYHGFGVLNPLVSLLVSNPRYGSLQGFPFESLGLVALCLLLLLAATSHDFWNANLGPRLWKAIHLSVYAAYALLVAHVALGVMLYEGHPIYWLLLTLGPGAVAALQLYAAFFASGRVRPTKVHAGAHADAHAHTLPGWLKVGPALDIPDQRATVIEAAGAQRIAVFRYDGKVSAVSNVCRHQGGPLGEGRIVDGCITCPWHGFQYQPEDGCSPAPFNERIATFATRIEDGMVYVNPQALAPGTFVAPSCIDWARR